MRLYEALDPRAVTEFSYRYGDAKQAHILLSFLCASPDRDADVAAVLEQLSLNDMHGHDLSGNEIAKSHARYLIGGRQAVHNNSLFLRAGRG